MDPRVRFSSVASDYAAARPSYPDALADWMLRLGPVRQAVDLGCGTGISTRLLAVRGVDVIGIDPNPAMLAEARRAGGRYVEAEAAATRLPDACVDLVTCAQAMHWFVGDDAIAEIARVLRPGGFAVAYWNLRSSGPMLDDYQDVLRARVKGYDNRPGARPTLAALRSHPGVSVTKEARFRYAQDLDRAGLLARARSSSYVAHDVDDPVGLDAALHALFDRHASRGRVTLRYEVHALAWRPRPTA
jgi:SAM-dependent methyltransferase